MEVANQANHGKKKKKHQNPEGQFRFELDTCSKNKDLSGAISLYETAVSQNLRLNHYHYNALLYLCSNSLNDSYTLETLDSSKDSALDYGFQIFDHMLASGINPTEATITAVARLAVAKGDADLAFELVKNMGKYKISPRLRSYGPTLFAYCQTSEADKAYSVEENMVSMGVHPEEPELAVLLKVSSDARREEKVYLQKLRNCARCVNASTAEIIERWFCSSLASVEDWLDNHAEYEAVVDGANVGLYQQNFADGGFSLSQLDAVVRELYERSQKKWPLVILHHRRFLSLMENPSNRKMLEEWKAQGALYTTPNGSNDDWYWLYAAVKFKCLLVTDDEMRDHIFELLGSNFFLRWKERHQVRYSFMKCSLGLQMPPSYSLVIQARSCGHPVEVLANLEAPEAYQTPYNISFNLCKAETSTTDNGLKGNPISFPLSENKITAVTGKRKDRSPSNLKQHP
ncbi:hypothetical protein HHK36_016777 [Tetracentron sinense]|uniref:ribonuclease P n=1 Tax=Tetracentron sinense TaxID=13715 RepID=A0A834Z6H0_TETSI|nr:hypothetical protein HHK36_016777 [Tetracentron sinense]